MTNLTEIGDGAYAAPAWCPSCGVPKDNHLGPCQNCWAMGFTTLPPEQPTVVRTTRMSRLMPWRWLDRCDDCGFPRCVHWLFSWASLTGNYFYRGSGR